MKRLLLFLLIFSGITANAQNKHCATETYNQKLEQLYPTLSKGRAQLEQIIQQNTSARVWGTQGYENVYTIPVVVHVIYTSISNNISDAQVKSQIDILNNDYRRLNADTTNTPSLFQSAATDTKIKFCLASKDPNGANTNGIIRKQALQNGYDPENNSDDITLKNMSYWPSDQYLNIWVTDLKKNYLGYAQFPSTNAFTDLNTTEIDAKRDGVVIDHIAFGNTGTATFPFNKGRTVTHEVGHWLGLYHTFGYQDDNDDSNCSTDYVADTPSQKSATPSNKADCSPRNVSCEANSREMLENYLDYSPDRCMNLFTKGQKDRMRAVLETSNRRKKLLSSQGCCLPFDEKSVPVSESFESPLFPTEGWEIINPDGDNTWTRSTPGGFNNSIYSLQIQNTVADSGRKDVLRSPYIQFENIENPFLEFSLAYAQSTPADAATDKLILFYSPNCSDSVIIKTFSGSELVTSSKHAGNFIPAAEDWKRIKIDLRSLGKIPAAQLSFENQSKGKNNLYIDDINLYNTTDKIELKVLSGADIHEFIVDITFREPQNIHLTLFNSIGQKVWETEEKNTSSFKKTISFPTMPEGVYILRAQYGKNYTAKRIRIPNK